MNTVENVIFELGPSWTRIRTYITSLEMPTIDIHGFLSYIVEALVEESRRVGCFHDACSELAYGDYLTGNEQIDDLQRMEIFDMLKGFFMETYGIMKSINLYHNGKAPFFFRGLLNGNSIILSISPGHYHPQYEPVCRIIREPLQRFG